MNKNKVTLTEAVKFHGHLGPYLVLGLKAGEMALKKLGCKKYFGLEVRVWGAGKKPKSCLVDGLQLSSGATYGKGNIDKLNGPLIKIGFCNSLNQKSLILSLKEDIVKRLEEAKTHKECEVLAKEFYNGDSFKLFNIDLKKEAGKCIKMSGF